MKKGDIIIIGVVLVIAISGLFLQSLIGNSSLDKRLIIKQDQVLLHDIELTDDLSQTLKIGEYSNYNIIQITNGMVKVHQADCKNQVCVKDGEIRKIGQILVCLPHKLTIEIQGEKSDIDLISK